MNNCMHIILFDDDIDFTIKFKLLITKLLQKFTYQIEFIHNPKLDYLSPNDYQVFFVDIKMPKISGFELADMLRKKGFNGPLIFVSYYESYVFQSFSFKPLCFIRKSVLVADLDFALSLLIFKYYGIYKFSYRGKLYSINHKDILYITKYKNNIEITTSTGIFQTRSTLNEALKNLNQFHLSFIQIHKSIIVNVNKIRKFENNTLILYNNQNMIISRKFIEVFIKEYYQNIFINKGEKNI